MSSDSFESSTLGPKALEARLKAEAERKRNANEQAARERDSNARREAWKQFQNEVSGEYEQVLSGRANPKEPAPALNRTGSLLPTNSAPQAPQPLGRLKRF